MNKMENNCRSSSPAIRKAVKEFQNEKSRQSIHGSGLGMVENCLVENSDKNPFKRKSRMNADSDSRSRSPVNSTEKRVS